MAEADNNSPIGEEKLCPSPDCQFDKHKARSNFCILCGTLLYRRCDDCLDENPRYARFCHYCGANLDEIRVERGEQVGPNPTAEQFADEPSGASEETEDEAGSQEKQDEEDKGTIFDIS